MALVTKDKVDKAQSEMHKGHRDRMRARFLKYGFGGLAEHEILELLLYYVVPRRDTNPIAHELISKYGSLAGVLNAPIAELEREKNVSHSGAVLLKMFARSPEIGTLVIDKKPHLGTPREVARTVRRLLLGKEREEVLVLCLDKNDRLIRHFIAKGTTSHVAIGNRDVVQKILHTSAAGIIVAHNHPGGDATPSKSDVEATVALVEFLALMGVNLYDHIIVGEKRSFSFAMNGLIPNQKTK